ncbi:MAG: helix-hairpin-helix domain-containing protein [Fimbriimonadaceae bacterium]
MRNKQSGGILVITLVVMAAIVAALSITAANQEIRTRVTINRLEQRRARLAADAGVARAMAALATQDPNLVLQEGDWFTLGNSAADRFLIGDDSFRLEIKDASSLVSLNTATEEQLLNLGLTTEQTDSLLDWREPDGAARPEGAKNDYYNSLQEPYNIKGARLDSLDELILIRGFDNLAVYGALQDSSNAIRNGEGAFALYQLVTTDGFSPNVGQDGQPKTDVNQAQLQQFTQAGIPAQTAAAIIARRNGQGTFTSMSLVLQTPGLNNNTAGTLLDRFSVSSEQRVEGKLNLNTVSETTLQSIPNITTDIAQAIVSQQANGGFAALSEIFQIPGMTLQLAAETADRFAVGSDTFLVRVTGRAGRTDVSIEAVVQIQNGTPVLLKTLETPQRDMRSLWNWTDETTNEVEIIG